MKYFTFLTVVCLRAVNLAPGTHALFGPCLWMAVRNCLIARAVLCALAKELWILKLQLPAKGNRIII